MVSPYSLVGNRMAGAERTGVGDDIHRNSMEGDALSTAVFALGTEKGTGLIESLENTEAVLIDRNRNVTMTSGAGKYFEN